MTTAIEWTDETWNPTTGCDRTSPGCDHCYALTMAARLKGMGQGHYQVDGDPRTSGPGFGVTVHPDALDKPLHWRRPRRVFVNSMSDLFHKDVPDDFIARVLGKAAAAERHTFQILTKRPQRMAALMADPAFQREIRRYWWATWFMLTDTPDPLPARRATDPEKRPPRFDRSAARRLVWAPGRTSFPLGSSELPMPPPNVWLGTSIESDRYAFRADHLRATPAAVRFLSLEPLLGPLPSLDLTGIDWVIVGGESGPGARPMHPSWARDLRDRCVDAGVPFFFKQWGEWRYGVEVFDGAGRTVYKDDEEARRVGKHAAGRELDGRTWDEMPMGRST